MRRRLEEGGRGRPYIKGPRGSDLGKGALGGGDPDSSPESGADTGAARGGVALGRGLAASWAGPVRCAIFLNKFRRETKILIKYKKF